MRSCHLITTRFTKIRLVVWMNSGRKNNGRDTIRSNNGEVDVYRRLSVLVCPRRKCEHGRAFKVRTMDREFRVGLDSWRGRGRTGGSALRYEERYARGRRRATEGSRGEACLSSGKLWEDTRSWYAVISTHYHARCRERGATCIH